MQVPKPKRLAAAAVLAHCLALAAAGPAGAAATELPSPTKVRVIGETFPVNADAELQRKATETHWRTFASPAGGVAARQLASSWCGDARRDDDTANAAASAGPAVKVVYARPSDMPERFGRFADLMQDDIRAMVSIVADAARSVKTLRVDVGTRCGSEYVDIISVVLPKPRSSYVDGLTLNQRYDAINRDVRAAVGSLSFANHLLIYGDTLSAGDSVVGVAGLFEDADRPDQQNPHNKGGLSAILFGNSTASATNPQFSYGANRQTAALHELTHALGAVQDSAPHSTKSGHCVDVQDVMCYADGSAYAGKDGDMQSRCPSSAPRAYDCGGDDYFNPAPAAGSYLSNHWNIYNSAFLCPVNDCIRDIGNHAPRPAIALTDTDGRPISRATAGTQVVLDGSGSADAEGSIQSWAWDVGDDDSTEGGGVRFLHTFTRVGDQRVRLIVKDGAGAPNSTVLTFPVDPVGEHADVRALRDSAAAPPTAAAIAKKIKQALRIARARLRNLGARGFRRRGLWVAFTSPGAGTLSGSVRAGARTLARARLRATGKGRVKLTLRPTGAAKRWLARAPRGTRLTLRLTFVP